MVFGVRLRRESQEAEQAVEEHVRNIAAFPLAIPLLAGPGAITATVLLPGVPAAISMLIAILIGVVVLVAFACFLAFLLRRADRPLSRPDRQHRAVATARRAAGGACRAICGRWRARDPAMDDAA